MAPQAGEDVNANGVLDRYGETPHRLTVNPWRGWIGTGFDAALSTLRRAAAVDHDCRGERPAGAVSTARCCSAAALKLVNAGVVAGVSRLPTDGLTVVSENPVYVQGNYNATNDPVVNATEAHVPASHHRRLGGHPLEQLDRRRLVQIPRTTSPVVKRRRPGTASRS